MTRRFEFVAGSSAKFWEIGIEGTDAVVHFGRIGTDGQTQVKSFPDVAAATRHAENLMARKLGKGYTEVAVC